jgi:hypothetical protein
MRRTKEFELFTATSHRRTQVMSPAGGALACSTRASAAAFVTVYESRC